MTRKERWVPYAFLLPALAGLLVFRLLPTFYGVYRSFYATSFGMNPRTRLCRRRQLQRPVYRSHVLALGLDNRRL